MLLIFNYIFYCALLFPIFGTLLLMLIPANKKKLLKIISLNVSCLTFTSFLMLWLCFYKDTSSFQFVLKIFWLFNLNFSFGLDGISFVFVLLTTMLVPLCFLISWNSISIYLKQFLIIFLLLEFFLIITFCILDLFLFYIFFESVLLPMFIITGIWGS